MNKQPNKYRPSVQGFQRRIKEARRKTKTTKGKQQKGRAGINRIPHKLQANIRYHTHTIVNYLRWSFILSEISFVVVAVVVDKIAVVVAVIVVAVAVVAVVVVVVVVVVAVVVVAVVLIER